MLQYWIIGDCLDNWHYWQRAEEFLHLPGTSECPPLKFYYFNVYHFIVSLPASPPSIIVCKLDHRLHSNIISSFHRLAQGQMTLTLVQHIWVHSGSGRPDIWILASSNVELTKSDHWNKISVTLGSWLIPQPQPQIKQRKFKRNYLSRLSSLVSSFYNFLSFIFIYSKLSNCVQRIQQGKLLKNLIKE